MGPPPHIHANEDEQFHIIKGSFTFFVGEDVIEARAQETMCMLQEGLDILLLQEMNCLKCL